MSGVTGFSVAHHAHVDGETEDKQLLDQHLAENSACTFPEGDTPGPHDIPNGALIAAAIHAGFRVKTYTNPDSGGGSPNANFNMSATSLTEMDIDFRPSGARARARKQNRGCGVP